jgi:hypothetical protein
MVEILYIIARGLGKFPKILFHVRIGIFLRLIGLGEV